MLLDTILTIIIGLLVLTVLVVIHELGHFMVGRKCGIKILEFGVGFGPKLWNKTKKGIRYSIRALPLGGFVQFEGEDGDSKDPRAFTNRSLGQRAATLAAGPLMNILAAFLITVCILTFCGDNAPFIKSIEPDSPAYTVGLESGDRTLRIDGETIDFDTEFRMKEFYKGRDTMEITVLREGTEYTYDVPYYYDTAYAKWRIGITETGVRVYYGFLEAIALSFKWLYVIMLQIFGFLGGLFTKGVGANDVAGPVGTITIIGQAAMRSGLETLLRIAAILSINLGIVNLLPFPAMDGGRLVFVGIEKLRGKPLPREKEGYVHFAGLVVLFGLMILLTYQDITRLISG